MTHVLMDPLSEVTGVSSADILRRLATVRSGGLVPQARAHPRSRTWRLVDFGDGTDANFVAAAHEALLKRPPRPEELARRLGDLQAGSSRLEVVLRLAWCPEGRRLNGRPVAGSFLRTVVAIGTRLEGASAHPVLGTVVGAARPAGAFVLGRNARARAVRRGIGATVVVGAALAGRRKSSRLRRELATLRDAAHSTPRQETP